MVSKFVLSNLLLASAALAAPSSQQARLARRQENHQPVNSVASFARDVQEYPNGQWAGIVVTNSSDSHGITSVTASFTVPPLSGGSGINHTCGFSMWVGLDGFTCENGFWAGIDGLFENGMVSYNAWYNLQAEQSAYVSVPDYPINAHDVLTVTVTADFGTSPGQDSYTAVFKNQTTGKSVAKEEKVSGPRICGTEARWITGVHMRNQALTLADFGIATFTDATAAGPSKHLNLLNATTNLEIVQNLSGNKTLFTYMNATKDSLLVQYLSGH